ncbi:MAG: discoidin domain-containing protein, partial [Alloprevotella sp.]
MMRLLFCTLLLAVLPQGVLLAQEHGKVYKITNIYDGYTFGENASGTLVQQQLAGTETATQLWLCVEADGRYAFVNASSGRCLNSGASGWTTQKNAEYFYLVSKGTQADNATHGAGKTVYNITTSSTAAGSTCLHCYATRSPISHTGGEDNNANDGTGSKWTFEEATDVTLTTINTSLADYMASLVAAKETFASAVAGVTVTQLSLTATVESTNNASANNYLWSNAPHNGDSDNAGCIALLDGSTSTYFHSRYSGVNPNEYHYLQINNITDAPTAFRLRMTSRNGNNKPTELLISGSTDGTNFVPITTLRKTDYTPLFAGSGQESYVSKVLSTGTAYTYLRFTVKQTNTGNLFGTAPYSYPFFTLAEFAIDKVTGTANSALADYAFKYATLNAAVTAAWGKATEMSATFLPAYYTVGDLDAVNTAVAAVKAALSNSVGDGTPDLELQPMDYYVYYTNERGVRKYLSINANTHAVELSDDPAVFTFTKSTAAGVSTNAYIMQMNDYHIGHWVSNSSGEAFGPEPDTNGDTYTSPWHAQAFYYDVNHAKLAIRNTNATGENFYAHYFMYVDPNGNLKGVASTADNAHLLYQWTVQPVYPFALNGEKKYFIKTRVGTSYRRLLRMNLTENNVPLVEGNASTSDAYWQFAQAESYGHYYLRIIPCVNTAKVLSYQASAVGNGDNKFTAQDANASGYQQNFLLGPTGVEGAPYYFQVPGTTFYMSNIYGTGRKMGFYNVLDDPGSLFAIIEVPENARFYRLKGHSSGNYMDASGVADSDNRMSMKSEAECSATGSVFYLTADNKLLSLYNGLYLTDTYSQTAQGEANGNTLTIFPSEGDVEGKYTLYTNFSGSKYVYDNTVKIDRNPSYAVQCNWTLERVTSLPVNISSVGWATFYAPVPIHIPADGEVAAYTVAINETAGTCALTQVIGDIPANTGLVLRKCNGGL